MKHFLEKYKTGFDFWALVACAVVLLPEIVYLCVPGFPELDVYPTFSIFSRVFQIAGCIILIFFMLKEPAKKRPFFDSYYLTAALSLMLDYTAWILFFCGINNFGALIFLKVCPCVTLLLFSMEKKNYLAAPLLAIYSLLQIIPFCIGAISGALPV